MRVTTGVFAATVALALTACSGGMKDADPEGWKACDQYASYSENGTVAITDPVTEQMVVLHAQESGTKAIRRSLTPITDANGYPVENREGETLYRLNGEALEKACASSGYERA